MWDRKSSSQKVKKRAAVGARPTDQYTMMDQRKDSRRE